MNDLESQLQELFNEVKTMIQLGKENDAVDLLEANYEAVKEQMASGATDIEEAAILDVIALGYMVLGDLQTVGSILDVVIYLATYLGTIFLHSLYKIFNYMKPGLIHKHISLNAVTQKNEREREKFHLDFN